MNAPSSDGLAKPTFTRVCPDCGRTYTVDASYIDEAYAAHARNEPYAVCGPCFDAFNGMTVEQMLIAEGEGQ